MNKTITKMKQLGVSFESAPVELPVDTQPVAELPEPELTNDELVVIAEADAAQATHDQLSALATTLESMAAADGMSDTEAALFSHAREAIVAGTPLEAPAPAMESFGTAAARLNNAQVALEDVNSKLKAAADWVKKTIKEFLQMLSTAFKRWADAIGPTAEKIEKRDLSLLESVPRSIELALELSDTNIMSVAEGIQTGDYVSAINKISHWADLFMEKIIPDSKFEVMKLLKNKDLGDVTNETIIEALNSAYSAVKFSEVAGDDGAIMVSEPLFSAFRLQRKAGGYTQLEFDLSSYKNPGFGKIPSVTKDQAEKIRNASVDVLHKLQLMSELPNSYAELFNQVQEQLGSESIPLHRTIIRGIMANASDVTMKFYREALKCIKTTDSIVVATMKEAAEQKGTGQ